MAGRDHVYWYDASNRLTNVLDGPGGPSVIGLGHDARGNVNNKNGHLFVFDQGNRLRTALGTEAYRYDAHGRRVRTSSTAGALYEMYSLDGKLLWQCDEQIGLRFQQVYLNGSVVAIRRRPVGAETEDIFYWHNDALGSQIATTVGTSVAQTTEHEPYGKMLNRTNNNRIGYTGHVMDQATGLIYMQQRYYDSQLGRFLSVDPVTAYSNPVGAFNRYWYANNDPYGFTDPDGRQACGKDTTCQLQQGAWGGTIGPIPQAPGDGQKIVQTSSSSSSSRWSELKGRLGLQGDLTKNGNIFDVGALAHDVFYPLMDSPGGAGLKVAGLGFLAATLRAEGQLVFRTGHYASRLESKGLSVARTEAVIAREVSRIRPNMTAGADVVGRVRVNGVLVEYRVRALADGAVNVGTIFPVKWQCEIFLFLKELLLKVWRNDSSLMMRRSYSMT